ncbi:MAG TPA: tRNA lysidine(34) synthetase TilS [Bacteroidales bacterium]|nr:tRNA lysidine(34) synthetase TilS [Bacteroidales bacterium]
MTENKSLFDQFIDNLAKKKLAGSNRKVLLAVSGGLDSMVMVYLFNKSGISFALAHCNFCLRGKDSDLDMALVEQTSVKLGVFFFCKKFDTKKYSRENKLSVQEAARDLRYSWLLETARKNGYDLVATAHHLDDSIETLLINILRGTGIKGLGGIPEKTANIIRPLLFASREEIEEYARIHKIEFRLDKSNLESIYLRNRLRKKVIPVLKEFNPGFCHTMRDFFELMTATSAILERDVNTQRDLCIKKEKNGISVSITALLKYPYPGLLLFEFLKDYHFSPSVCRQLFESLPGQPGKIFHSKTHQAIKDRDKIFIIPYLPEEDYKEYNIEMADYEIRCGNSLFRFEIKPFSFNEAFASDESTARFDAGQLIFPLTLRKTKPGDWLIPLGMKGKKKVSDLLSEKKIPVHVKKETWVLTSGNQIVWVAGIRTSETAKIGQGTKLCFVATMVVA